MLSPCKNTFISHKMSYLSRFPDCTVIKAQYFLYFLYSHVRYNKLATFQFLPARRYASAGLCDSDVSVRPSVCPSVCPSVTRRYCAYSTAKAGSWNVHHLIAPFWRGMIHRKIRKGSPQRNVPNEGGLGFLRRFSTNMSSYLENGAF